MKSANGGWLAAENTYLELVAEGRGHMLRQADTPDRNLSNNPPKEPPTSH